MAVRPKRIVPPSLNPRAQALCARLKKIMRGCGNGVLLSLLSTVVIGPLAGIPFGLCASGFVFAYFVRLTLVALFFTRYSLAHLLFVTLSLSVCVSLLMLAPGEWKIIPALGLLAVVLLVHAYIQVQDPEGDNFTPPFIRETVHARRRRDREKARPR